MASKHICLNAVRHSATSATGLRGASSSLRTFSSLSNWISTTCPRATTAQSRGLRISHQQSLCSRSKISSHLTPRRHFSSSPSLRHGHLDPPKPGEELTITFIDKSLQRQTFSVSAGDNLLDIAIANDLDMEGACGGSCACSTCHVIVEDEKLYDSIDEPDDDENDMLDLAFGLTETSRLGCQVTMTKELDGLVVRLPSMTRNLQKSDFEGR